MRACHPNSLKDVDGTIDMPLPGGASAKLGNRYELWWTVYQLLDVLRGVSDSLYVEDLGIDKSEFTLKKSSYSEFHQCKRSNTAGKWTLGVIRVLPRFRGHLS